jgi:hypothetical protein
MKTGRWYTSFAHEFQRWHYRMTPKGKERADACTFLSALQTVNLFMLTLWAPPVDLSRWAFVALFLSCFLALHFFNKRVFADLDIPAAYATWTDQVPRFKEFPRVYSYLLFTAAVLLAPIFVAARSPA